MRRSTQQGFTLLEVMVATLIMAIAVTGLLAALSTSMRNAARLTDYDRAALLGRQKMDELLLARDEAQNQVLQGSWDASATGGQSMGWRALIAPFEVPVGAAPRMPILERVQLEIWWMNGDNRKTFTLEGFRRALLPLTVGGTQ